MDRNEKQNSYKNTANTRGAGKQIKKLARTNKIMGGVIVVLLAIVCGLGIGYSRLNKEYKKTIQQNQENEQKDKAAAESETTAAMETQSETEKISESSEAQTEAETFTETEKVVKPEQITETELITETESEMTTEAASGENDTESASETEMETDMAEQLPLSNWGKKSRLAKEKLEELLRNEGIEVYYCIAPASEKNNVEILNQENSDEAVLNETVSNIDDLSQREDHPELSRLFVLGAFYQNMQYGYGGWTNDELQSLCKRMLGREDGDSEEAQKKELELMGRDNATGEEAVLEFMNSVKASEEMRTEIQTVSPEECIAFFQSLKEGTLIQDEKDPERSARMQKNIILPSVHQDEFSDMNAMLAQAEQDGNQISWVGENKDGYQYLVMLTEAGNGFAASERDENSYILYLKTKNENGNGKKLLETVYQCMMGSSESSRSETAGVSEESTDTETSHTGSADDTTEQETVLSEVQQ